jgi:AcrR family transcriptional regulator
MADKRTDIVETALGLVQEEGLAGLTQPRVAKKLGLRQSHVTYYFPTRGDLLAAVTELAVQRRAAALEPMRRARTLQQKVRALATALTDPGQTRVLLALAHMADSEPALRPQFRALNERITPAAVSILQAAGAEASPESIGLLQTTSTGMAVLALATGRTEQAPVIAMLLHFLDTLPKSSATKSSGAIELDRKDQS